jgi:signal transduction histidine kinase
MVVRPVEYLHQAVVKVAGRDFRAKVPIHSHDELGELAGAFNLMAERLQEARDQERRDFQRDKLTALGELSLAMAHEIRNPIGVISTAAGLLEKHAEDAGRRNELVRMIREESQSLNQLLRDFQQLARHRRPEFALVDPVAPLEQAVRLMLAGREEIAVERDYRHGEARIRGDGDLLQQAWSNLVRNALEAIGNRPGRLMLAARRDGSDVVVTLEDSGPGIPAEMIGRLFEPFFTTKEHGTGLGLTIANTLVEANGGRLELVPGGGGARIAMRLPQATEEE